MTTHSSQLDSRGRSAIRWIAPTLVVIVCLIMLGWTWQRCPGPIVDFGREIYIPWRITEGQVLYRDLSYFNGPLSPYLNAALFELFGLSLRTLRLANATITIAVALLVYGLIRQLSDRLTGLAAGIAFATIFACGHVVAVANFNFLTPYSHDLTHGVALSLVMLWFLWKASERNSLWFSLGAGLALGGVLLTKPEVSLAAVLGAAAAMAMIMLGGGRARVCIAFILAMFVPPLVAIALLSREMPLWQASLGCAGAWAWVLDERVTGLPFFRQVMGTDELEKNIVRTIAWVLRYAVLFIPAVLVGLVLRGRLRAWGALITTIAVIAIGSILTISWQQIPWKGVIRPLPWVLLVMALVQVTRLIATRSARPNDALALGLSVFSVALLAKIFFNVLPLHYGFALAMPGTMLLIGLLVWQIPTWVDRRGGFGWFPRAVGLTALAVLIGGHVVASARMLNTRIHPIGTGADRFLTDARGPIIDAALRDLRQSMAAGDTLLVIPEGAMLNFLLRAPSPVRWQNFLPSEMMMYGEQTMLDEIERHSPTLVAIVNRDATEYGAQYFGEDYGRKLAGWLREHYEPIELRGHPPFRGDEFGILLLRRKSENAS